MGRHEPASQPGGGPSDRTGSTNPKKRVRSGCRTCKIRKVKCDENRPACTKCVSTGRVCEGYEVWGGGNTMDLVFQTTLTKRKLLGIVPLESQDERGFVDWFRCRTSPKMQGAFGSPFWETLVFQASLEESSIFHAMLALSSVHKRVCFGVGEAEWERDPDRLEQFTLRQYSKAINQLLRPNPTRNENASTRVALICCMLFICLELLRGRYIAANNHLQNGMTLLAGLNSSGKTHRTMADDWLTEAFSRMNLLAVQYGHGHRLLPDINLSDRDSLHTITFQSVAQARNVLDSLNSDILVLQAQVGQDGRSDDLVHVIPKPDRVRQQSRIVSDLAAWFVTYKASRVNLQNQLGRVSKIGYELLFLFYAMATILADTCLRPDDEMAFDTHSQNFDLIISHSSAVLDAVQAVHSLDNPAFRSGFELCLFNADIGWTPPLYYTALHCRDLAVRTRAIKLLRVFPSKEGVWDSIFAASVAQQIVQIEEEIYNEHVQDNPRFEHDGEDTFHSMKAAPWPASCRVYNVQLTLPDSPSGSVMLTCNRKKENGDCEVITRKHDQKLDSWTDSLASDASGRVTSSLLDSM